MSRRPLMPMVMGGKYWQILGGQWARAERKNCPKNYRISIRGRNIGRSPWRRIEPYETALDGMVWNEDGTGRYRLKATGRMPR